MKLFNIIAIFFALYLPACSALRPQSDSLASPPPPLCPTTASNTQCLLYHCLEKQYQCGASGYPLGYGARYCTKFQNGCDGSLLDIDSQAWIAGVTMCLQNELEGAQAGSSSCQTIENNGFSSHPYCYTNGSVAFGGKSFCSLSPSKWRKIAGCVDSRDFYLPRSLAQINNTALKCAAFFAGGFFLDDGAPDVGTQALIDSMTAVERDVRAQEFLDFASEVKEL